METNEYATVVTKVALDVINEVANCTDVYKDCAKWLLEIDSDKPVQTSARDFFKNIAKLQYAQDLLALVLAENLAKSTESKDLHMASATVATVIGTSRDALANMLIKSLPEETQKSKNLNIIVLGMFGGELRKEFSDEPDVTPK